MEAVTRSSAPRLLGQAAQNLGFLCFPCVVLELVPRTSLGGSVPGAGQEAPFPCPGGPARVMPLWWPQKAWKPKWGICWSRNWNQGLTLSAKEDNQIRTEIENVRALW